MSGHGCRAIVLAGEGKRVTLALIMQKTDGGERWFVLHREHIIIGRIATCDLQLALPDVADQHCELRREGNRWRVRPLAADPPTVLNDRPLDPQQNDQPQVSHGDRLLIGPVTFKLCRADSIPTDGNRVTRIVEIKMSPTNSTTGSSAGGSL